MRLIAILMALLIVGFLTYKQMGGGSNTQLQQVQNMIGDHAPKVPTSVNEVKQFASDMNDYVKDEAAKRAEEIEKAASR